MAQKIRVMGLDLSLTESGLVILENGSMIKSEIIKSKPSGKNINCRFKRIEQILNQITSFCDDINYIIIEGYSFASRSGQAFSIGELGGVVKFQLWLEKDIALFEVAPPSLKKFITGRGNCDKNIVIKEVYKNFGIDFTNDNLADAFGLAYFGWSLHNILSDKNIKLKSFQKEVIKKYIQLHALIGDNGS